MKESQSAEIVRTSTLAQKVQSRRWYSIFSAFLLGLSSVLLHLLSETAQFSEFLSAFFPSTLVASGAALSIVFATVLVALLVASAVGYAMQQNRYQNQEKNKYRGWLNVASIVLGAGFLGFVLFFHQGAILGTLGIFAGALVGHLILYPFARQLGAAAKSSIGSKVVASLIFAGVTGLFVFLASHGATEGMLLSVLLPDAIVLVLLAYALFSKVQPTALSGAEQRQGEGVGEESALLQYSQSDADTTTLNFSRGMSSGELDALDSTVIEEWSLVNPQSETIHTSVAPLPTGTIFASEGSEDDENDDSLDSSVGQKTATEASLNSSVSPSAAETKFTSPPVVDTHTSTSAPTPRTAGRAGSQQQPRSVADILEANAESTVNAAASAALAGSLPAAQSEPAATPTSHTAQSVEETQPAVNAASQPQQVQPTYSPTDDPSAIAKAVVADVLERLFAQSADPVEAKTPTSAAEVSLSATGNTQSAAAQSVLGISSFQSSAASASVADADPFNALGEVEFDIEQSMAAGTSPRLGASPSATQVMADFDPLGELDMSGIDSEEGDEDEEDKALVQEISGEKSKDLLNDSQADTSSEYVFGADKDKDEDDEAVLETSVNLKASSSTVQAEAKTTATPVAEMNLSATEAPLAAVAQPVFEAAVPLQAMGFGSEENPEDVLNQSQAEAGSDASSVYNFKDDEDEGALDISNVEESPLAAQAVTTTTATSAAKMHSSATEQLPVQQGSEENPEDLNRSHAEGSEYNFPPDEDEVASSHYSFKSSSKYSFKPSEEGSLEGGSLNAHVDTSRDTVLEETDDNKMEESVLLNVEEAVQKLDKAKQELDKAEQLVEETIEEAKKRLDAEYKSKVDRLADVRATLQASHRQAIEAGVQPPTHVVENSENKDATGEEQANIEAKNDIACTTLLQAALQGRTPMVKLFLSKGENIEADDEQGRTALFHAAKNGHTEVVKLLLSKGAKIDARDKEGKTAQFYAVQYEHMEIAALLEKAVTVKELERRHTQKTSDDVDAEKQEKMRAEIFPAKEMRTGFFGAKVRQSEEEERDVAKRERARVAERQTNA